MDRKRNWDDIETTKDERQRYGGRYSTSHGREEGYIGDRYKSRKEDRYIEARYKPDRYKEEENRYRDTYKEDRYNDRQEDRYSDTHRDRYNDDRYNEDRRKEDRHKQSRHKEDRNREDRHRNSHRGDRHKEDRDERSSDKDTIRDKERTKGDDAVRGNDSSERDQDTKNRETKEGEVERAIDSKEDKRVKIDVDDTDAVPRKDLTKAERQKIALEKRAAQIAAMRGEIVERDEEDSTSDRDEVHWSKKSLKHMSQRDWRILREEFNIVAKGGTIPNPIRNWEESGLPSELLEAVKHCGYKSPTAIQMQAIPIGIQGRDIIGVAETGSGKTASFVLPMLVYLSKMPKITAENALEGPYALILAPARELAQQIEQQVTTFAVGMGLRCVLLVGGEAMHEQVYSLRKGCEIVIACPGRVIDCLSQRLMVLNQCAYVVLDEADRMIDMGFEPQVNTILDAMPKASDDKPKRVMTMYSATMPTGVERIARKYLRRPATVTVGEFGKDADVIKQVIEFVKTDHDKHRKLTYLLENGPTPPIIIFANGRTSCDAIMKRVGELGYNAVSLHGGKTQPQREIAMDGFRNGKHDILIATDVLSRGIDVKGVTHVINYDMPNNIKDYTHRIGRTGRAGEKGLATSLLTEEDVEIMYDLKKLLQNTNNHIPRELSKHPHAQYKAGTAMDKPII